MAIPTQKKTKVRTNDVKLQDTPMFIVVGSDDNGLVDRREGGALTWLGNYLQDKKNPCSSKKNNEFDGIPVRFAFYVTARYGLRQGFEDNESVLTAWRSLYENGHELGNHSTEHLMTVKKKNDILEDIYFDGTSYTKEEWLEKEFAPCHQLLMGDRLNIPETAISGWRTPRISEWNNSIFRLLEEHNYLYDSSLEYFSETGKDFICPHCLGHGSPVYPDLDRFAELWEIPVYNLVLPDDVKTKIDSIDKNKHFCFDLDFFLSKEKGGLALTGEDYFKSLKYSLHQRIEGNRCPFVITIHSDIYSARRDKDCPSTTARERQQAFENFVDYALNIPEVRFVTPVQLIKWLT